MSVEAGGAMSAFIENRGWGGGPIQRGEGWGMRTGRVSTGREWGAYIPARKDCISYFFSELISRKIRFQLHTNIFLD